MDWIPIEEREPKREREFDVYTNCICGISKKYVVLDAIYYHAEKQFFHNQDTTHSMPIPATHWMPTIEPPM